MNTRAGARQVLALIGAFACLVAGPIVAMRMLEDHDATAGLRALAVAIGVISQLPWLGLVAWLTVHSDEYARDGMYKAMGIGLGLAILVLAAVDYLQVAGFLGWDVLPPSWQIVILCWGAGLGVVRAVRGPSR